MKKKLLSLSDDDILKLTSLFKILSEPSRLKILRALFSGEKCVSDIIDNTGLLQANVSKQLRILQDSKVVSCRPSGLQRYYRIIDDNIFNICKMVCKKSKIK